MLTVAFGNFDFKGAKRAFNDEDDNKEQVMGNNGSLSQTYTKMPLTIFSKAKSKINKQFRELAGALHSCKDIEPTSTVSSSADYTIPPLGFSEADLSIVAEEVLDTLQHTSESVPAVPTADTGAFKPVAAIAECVAASSASHVPRFHTVSATSISTDNNEADEQSSTGSAASTETALTIHSDTAIPLQPSEGSLEQGSSLQSAQVIAVMTHKNTKALPLKLAEALRKLKSQLWPWKRTQSSTIKLGEKEDCSDRCQWDVVTKIEPDTIVEVLRAVLSKRHKSYLQAPMKIIGTAQGTYHLVFMVKTVNPATQKLEGWVVKIPGHGTPDRWNVDDMYMLAQEVETIRLITTYTDVPAPLVAGYSATLDNEFGFPYVVMKELPGKTACELWYDEHAEMPSPETEKKRLNFLHSLAGHMTELNKLRFDQVGMPQFNPRAEDFENYDDIEDERLPVSKWFVWPFYDTFRAVERGPFASTQAYVHAGRNESNLPSDPEKGKMLSEAQIELLGTSKFLDIVFSHPVFQTTPKDTFALRHSDLDTQNILIDDTGNITGILDWDASLAMPRCVGHASVPHFLDRDWYKDAIMNTPFLHWRAAHYRNIYAAALVEAGNPDAMYTSKSQIYQAAFCALYEGGDKEDFMEHVLKEIPGQVDVNHCKFLLAKGCKITEAMLKTEIWKVLDPEMPAPGLLEKVEVQHAEAIVQAWMDEFADFSLANDAL